MGREVRKVPIDWEHPKNMRGSIIPLLGGSFSESAKKWDIENSMWGKGKRLDFINDTWVDVKDEYRNMSFEEWHGECPKKEDYMPDWNTSQATHYMMYENTTEGTPISPALETPEQLAHWLVNHAASAFAGNSATYKQWLRVCKGGYAPSMIIYPETGDIISGVAGLEENITGVGNEQKD